MFNVTTLSKESFDLHEGGGFAIFDIIARYISVTVQDSPIIADNDY